MKRRDFISGLGGTALCSLTARAQQTSVVVGVLEVGKEGTARAFLAPAWARLAEMGFVEGRNLTIESRGADFQQDRLTKLAEELVQRRVAAIVAVAGPPTVAAKSVTKSVPIIFRTGFDPVASGYVESLNRPGGNVTGVHILNVPAIFKRIEMLHELVPQAKSFAFFYTRTGDAVELPFYQSLQKKAEPLGVNVMLFNASRTDEVEEIFAQAKGANVGGIVVNDHPVFATNGGKPLVDLAARYELPTMYPSRFYVAAGGLVSYGSDNKEANRQLGELVGLVLKGEKPEDLPVRQVTKLELVVNAKTAKILGLEIPVLVAGLAEVIE
jgi:putative ABC transport system substrate-binding protein